MNRRTYRHATTGIAALAATAVALTLTAPASAGASPGAGDGRKDHGSSRAAMTLNGPSSVGRVVPVSTRTLWTSGSSRLAAGGTRSIRVTGRAGVPEARVRAVFLTVTATGARSDGRVTVSPAGGAPSRVTAAAVRTGHMTSGTALVRPGRDGRVVVRTSAAARLRVDVTAYVDGPRSAKSGAGGVTAVRGITRLDTARGLGGTALRGNTRRTVPVTGRGGVPSVGVAAVVVTVTLRPDRGRAALLGYTPGGDRSGRAAVWPMGAAGARSPLIATTILPVSRTGRVGLSSTRRADARLDVVGWVRAGGDRDTYATMPGGVAPISEYVLAGRVHKPTTVRPGQPRTVSILGVGAVPEQVGGVILQVTTSTRKDRRGALSVTTPGQRAGTDPVPVRGSPTRRLEFAASDASGTVVLSARGNAVRVRVSAVAYLPTSTPSTDPSAPPTVQITSPTSGSAVNLGDGGRVTVEGTATAGGAGLARVELYGDGSPLGVAELDTSVVPARWSTPVVAPAGPRTITAVAVSRDGQQASAVVSVVVALPPATQDVVDPDTVVVSEKETRSLEKMTADTMVFDDPRIDLDAGNVLALGPTDEAPEGALRRVVAVDIVDGTTVLRTEDASLVEAFTQLDIRSSDLEGYDVEDPDAAPTAAEFRARQRPAFTLSTRVSLQTALVAQDKNGKEFARLELKGYVTPALTIDLEVRAWWKWGFIPIPYVQLFRIVVSAKAEIGGALTFQTPESWMGTEKTIGKFPTGSLTFVVGIIPVVITSEFAVKAYGGAQLSGTISASIDWGFSAGYEYKGDANGGNSRRWSENTGANPQATASVTGSVEVGIKAEEGIYLYGAAGPELGIRGGLRGNLSYTWGLVNADDAAGWSVNIEAFLAGYVAARLKAFDYTLLYWSQDLVSLKFPVCERPRAPGSKAPFECPVPSKSRPAGRR